MGSIFLALNRNKKSLALDLSQAEAKPILNRLVERVDVVLHNMRPDAARSLGIDYDTLKMAQPASDPLFGFGHLQKARRGQMNRRSMMSSRPQAASPRSSARTARHRVMSPRCWRTR